MEKDKISKVEMARRMKTSRAALDRLLDPGNASVTLQTLSRAAHAIGRDLRNRAGLKLASPRRRFADRNGTGSPRGLRRRQPISASLRHLPARALRLKASGLS
jgi:hypothetical protein